MSSWWYSLQLVSEFRPLGFQLSLDFSEQFMKCHLETVDTVFSTGQDCCALIISQKSRRSNLSFCRWDQLDCCWNVYQFVWLCYETGQLYTTLFSLLLTFCVCSGACGRSVLKKRDNAGSCVISNFNNLLNLFEISWGVKVGFNFGFLKCLGTKIADCVYGERANVWFWWLILFCANEMPMKLTCTAHIRITAIKHSTTSLRSTFRYSVSFPLKRLISLYKCSLVSEMGCLQWHCLVCTPYLLRVGFSFALQSSVVFFWIFFCYESFLYKRQMRL